MPEVDPVIIPVRVSVDQTAAQGLGNQIRSAREAGAVTPAGGAGGTEAVTVRALQREYQHLEKSLQGVNLEFDRLLRLSGALADSVGRGAGGGLRPLPPAATPVGSPPAGGGGGTTVPGGPPGGPPGIPPSAGGAQGMLLQLLSGAGLTLGVGIGLRAATTELTSMATLSRSLEESSFLATIAGGQSGAVTQRMFDELRAGPGYKALTRPQDAAAVMRQLRQYGGRPTPADARLLADVGLTDLGSAGAGGTFATELLRTTGSDRALPIMMSLRDYSRDTSIGQRELVEQFSSLSRYFATQHGTRRLDPADERRLFALQEYFNALPEGIGRGDRAVAMQQGVYAASQHGLGKLAAVQGFIRETGRDPFASFTNMHEYLLWSRSAALVPAQERTFRAWGQGDPGAAKFWMESAGGFQPEQAEALLRADPVRRATLLRQYTQQGARMRAAAEGRGYEGDVGARSLETRVEEEQGRSAQTVLNEIEKQWEELRGGHPVTTAVGESLVSGLIGTLFWRSIFNARRRVRKGGNLAMGGRAGAPTAGGTGAATARQGMRGGTDWLGGIFGGLALGEDVLEAGRSPGDDWQRFIPGAIGALAGALVTGSPLGALFGYGIGSGARGLFAPDDAGGRTRAGMFADGWRRGEVEEHLTLLRGLTRGGGGAAATVPGQEPVPEAAAHFMPPSMRAWTSGRWERGRLRPDDPRIAAAARRHGLPLSLMLGVIDQESKFHTDWPGSSGELGPMQLMPDTAQRLAVDPRDVGQNLEGGAQLLREEIDAFPGDIRRALVAYNRGRRKAMVPGAVAGSDYDDAVLTKAERWREHLRGLQRQIEDLTSSVPRAERQAQARQEIEERALGPDESHGEGSREITIRLEPGPDLEGILQPSRTTVPGAHQRR